MNSKYITITPEIYSYIAANHSSADDQLLAELRAETEKLGGISAMQISPEQGSFLSLLVAAIGARQAIEIGTFTGYSSICIARGMGSNGKLMCYDRSDEWTSMARKYWERDGVSDRIELHLGAAADILRDLDPGVEFDFAFIDADKTGYDAYYELVLPHMRRNGLLVFDNMLQHGRIVEQPLASPDVQVIDALNRKLARDPRVESVLLPIADGLHICRKIML